jgi:hypothetical protein
MMTLAPGVAIWLATAPTDMRKGFDGLAQIVIEHVERNVLEGGLYAFFNKRRDRVKLLWLGWTDHLRQQTANRRGRQACDAHADRAVAHPGRHRTGERTAAKTISPASLTKVCEALLRDLNRSL